jgi:cell division protein YceG involved in septum cleavage
MIKIGALLLLVVLTFFQTQVYAKENEESKKQKDEIIEISKNIEMLEIMALLEDLELMENMSMIDDGGNNESDN